MMMRDENMASTKDGFTLIEVIIAIAVLAILAMPLLAYFTNASVSASKGKSTQRATMVAQAVTEELENCDTFSQVEDGLKADTSSGWSVTTPYDSANNYTELSKLVKLDGIDYVAKVKLDYDYEAKDKSGNSIGAKYNDYLMPQLKEIYSSSNVVVSETDQLSVALSNFLYYYPNDTKTVIKQGISRKVCLEIKKPTSGSDAITFVRGYYEYKYKDKDYTADIINTKIEWSKFKNVYYFYNLLNDTLEEEKVKITFDGVSMDEAKKLNVYFVDQYTDGITKPANYSLDFTECAGIPQYATYYTNNVSINNFSGNTVEEIVTYKLDPKRISKITVDVYEVGGTEKLTTIVTAKGA